MCGVLITGGAGFIGRHLAASVDGCAVVDRAPAEFEGAVDFRRADVIETGWEHDVDAETTIVHLAGASGSRDATPAQCERDNFDATVRVAELAAATGARLILASSSSVYGGPAPNHEDDRCAPLNAYGRSKLAAEQRALEVTGGAALALRFFTVYGPGQRQNMLFSRAIEAALTEQPLVVHDGAAMRDFTYVDETVRAIGLAIDNPDACGVINIGAGETHSVAEALAIVEAVTDRYIDVIHRESSVREPFETHADVERADEVLGFRNETSLGTGIERQVAAVSSESRRPSASPAS